LRVGIVANPSKPNAIGLARRAVHELDGRAEVILSTETEAQLATGLPALPTEAIQADALIAIGGDGTFLHTLMRSRVPLLPINAGTVGFLAEVEGGSESAFRGAIDRLVRGLYFLEERMKLAAHIGPLPLPDAMNEVVVHTSQVAKMRLFEVWVDGRPVGRLRGDGVILATPTGSTSYALSASGPIVDPQLEGIIIAGIAPYPATPRAVLLDPLRSVGVRLVQTEKDGVVVVDGQAEIPLQGGGMVTAYRSPRRAVFVRFGSRFFRRLHGKRILPWTEEPSDAEVADDADISPPT
jgi:NAD+ kinase